MRATVILDRPPASLAAATKRLVFSSTKPGLLTIWTICSTGNGSFGQTIWISQNIVSYPIVGTPRSASIGELCPIDCVRYLRCGWIRCFRLQLTSLDKSIDQRVVIRQLLIPPHGYGTCVNPQHGRKSHIITSKNLDSCSYSLYSSVWPSSDFHDFLHQWQQSSNHEFDSTQWKSVLIQSRPRSVTDTTGTFPKYRPPHHSIYNNDKG